MNRILHPSFTQEEYNHMTYITFLCVVIFLVVKIICLFICLQNRKQLNLIMTFYLNNMPSEYLQFIPQVETYLRNQNNLWRSSSAIQEVLLTSQTPAADAAIMIYNGTQDIRDVLNVIKNKHLTLTAPNVYSTATGGVQDPDYNTQFQSQQQTMPTAESPNPVSVEQYRRTQSLV